MVYSQGVVMSFLLALYESLKVRQGLEDFHPISMVGCMYKS